MGSVRSMRCLCTKTELPYLSPAVGRVVGSTERTRVFEFYERRNSRRPDRLCRFDLENEMSKEKDEPQSTD